MYDKVGRTDILGEAWRPVKANHGAPGVEGQALAEMGATGQQGARSEKRQAARRAPCYQFAPVRGVASPQPQGGTRPLGSATVEERVGQTALKRVLEPICEADFHDCSSGYRPKRDAKQASIAIGEALDNQAWGVGEIDLQSSCTSIAHGKRMKLSTQRMAEGRRLKLVKQTRRGGSWDQGQGVPPKRGGPQGSPISPLYSNIYLNRLDQLWHRRGEPAQLGAPLHRYAADALRVCRQRARPALAAFAASAERRELTLNRDKTREPRLTAGCDCLGFQFGKRKSPPSGKNTLYLFPAKSAQQTIRNKLKYLTARRAPSSPQECVETVNPLMTGWGNSFRHPNARQAFRGLQRFVNSRCRRYWPQRSTGRGVGGQRSPNSKR